MLLVLSAITCLCYYNRLKNIKQYVMLMINRIAYDLAVTFNYLNGLYVYEAMK